MAHLTPQQLQQNMKDAQEKIPLNSIWQHYRGNEYTYTIVGFDIDSETDLVRVHYKPYYLQDGIVFSHYVDNFLKQVEFEGKITGRFMQIK